MDITQVLFILFSISPLPIKGMTYVSWQAVDYPYSTSWKPQTYWNSLGIESVLVDTFQGDGALKLYVHLDPSDSTRRSGEVFVDIRFFPPQCNPPAKETLVPVDLRNKRIECLVWCPSGCGTPSAPSGLQMFVKDTGWHSCYLPSPWVNIASWRDSWYYLVDTLPASSDSFDPGQIISVGIKVGLNSNNTDSGFTGIMWLDNFNWADTSEIEYSFQHTGNALDSLSSLGCNYVALVNTWYMDSPQSNKIYPLDTFTHSRAELEATIREIRTRGMQVMVKPHINVGHPPWDTLPRSLIQPDNIAEWFASYRQFIGFHASILPESVTIFCLGTELGGLDTAYRNEWQKVIDTVRMLTPHCLLTYAANWNTNTAYRKVCFWDLVDYAGIDAYFPLCTTNANPSLEELVADWQHWIEHLHNWYDSILHKPVLFTEIGYISRRGANIHPWERKNNAIFAVSESLQARLYAAVMVSCNDTNWLKGHFWWHWTPVVDAGGPWDDHYYPQNKMATDTLRYYWSGAGGISEHLRERVMRIYSNPSRGKLRVYLPLLPSVSPQQINTLNIYDALGRSLKQVKIKPSTWAEIDLRALPDGVYFIQISNSLNGIHKVVLSR